MAMTVVIDLVRLLLGTPPPSFHQQKAIDLVDAWLNDRGGEPVCWSCPRAQFGSRLKQLVLEPWRLRQGSFDWCLPAAFLNTLLRRFPDEVVEFGLSLYDTGKGKLGAMKIDVPPELYAFDLPKYVRGELVDAPLEPRRRTEPIVFTHTDWILLAAVHGKSNGNSDYKGPINGLGAGAHSSQGTCDKLFEDTKFYKKVEDLSFVIPGLNDPDSVLEELGPSEKTDIVLFGTFTFFAGALELPRFTTGFHAAALVNPPVVEGTKLKLCFFSWGDDPAVEAKMAVTGGLEIKASGFGALSDVSGAVVARML